MNARVVHGVTANIAWMKKARCLRRGIAKFYLPGRPTTKEYQRIKDAYCVPCPVRAECLVTVMRQEIQDRHTSRGVQGGTTPAERQLLRRKIRDSTLCVTEGVRRWLNSIPLPRAKPSSTHERYTVTLTLPDTGAVVYEHTALTLKGAHLILIREQRRQGHQLQGAAYCPDGHLIEVVPPTDQGPPQKIPCPEP